MLNVLQLKTYDTTQTQIRIVRIERESSYIYNPDHITYSDTDPRIQADH